MATAAVPPLQCTPFHPSKHHAPDSASNSPSHAQWHFPGPSSHFNQRERAQTHTRSAVTRAITPSFNTERRAHRRAHSSYTVPTTTLGSSPSPQERPRSTAHRRMRSTHARFSVPHSPSSSDSGRSPLSRYSSFGASAMAGASPGVVTPAKQNHSNMQDSPFSDYFTDDNRSIDEIASQTLQPFETHQLLVRLNKLQSTLMRGGNDSQALYLVGRRMSEIESDMEALHSQSRQPPELDDGLFMEEENEAREEASPRESSACGSALDGIEDETADHLPPTPPTSWPPSVDVQGPDPETMKQQLARALQGLAEAEEGLSKRHQEFVAKKEELDAELRELKRRNKDLESENELMAQDVQLDHAELLLLDCQLQRFQSHLTALNTVDPMPMGPALDALRSDCRTAISNASKRRVRHSAYRNEGDSQSDEIVKRDSWKLEVIRSVVGRVDLMTLRRIQDSDEPALEIIETTAELVNSRRDILYTHAATQTVFSEDDDELPAYSDVDDDLASEDDDYDNSSVDTFNHSHLAELRRRAREEELYISDCAITTSPPSEVGGSITNDDNETYSADTAKGRVRNAWRELTNSLAELAGVGEHRWS